MEKIKALRAAFSAVLAGLTALWGWFGWLLLLWVLCMAGDFASGTLAALHRGAWTSGSAKQGIWHKAGCITVVLVAAAADLLLGVLLGGLAIALPFRYSVLLCPLVVVWYTLAELGSIIENAIALGAPVPAWLGNMLGYAKRMIEQQGEQLVPEQEE